MSKNYFMALFGLIHGMDFSNYFKALILDKSSIIKPLFGFNLGIIWTTNSCIFYYFNLIFLFKYH